jgi:1-acyl-sn-glycerol-3-phosphate acyltransferase
VFLIKLIRIGFVTFRKALKAFFKSKFSNSNKFSNNFTDFFFKEMKLWGKKIVEISEIELEIEGIENLSENEKYIFVANHTNLLDIPVLIEAIPQNIHFMYKSSLQKVPMLGMALKISPFIPLIRENNKNAMSGIENATKLLDKSGSVIIFPEGSRSETGELAQFKRGAFLIASKSNKKIVPVSIIGIEKILPKNQKFRINKGKVLVIINKAIEKIPENRTEMMNFINNLNDFMKNQIENRKIF